MSMRSYTETLKRQHEMRLKGKLFLCVCLCDQLAIDDLPREKVKDYVAMLLHRVLHSLLDAAQAP